MQRVTRVVFVQLGPKVASYVWANLRHVSRYFPNNKPVLVTDSVGTVRKAARLVPGLETFIYNRNEQGLSLPVLEREGAGRSDFWRYSSERILALNQWHSFNPNFSMLHIESDVLLLPSFPLEQLSVNHKLVWSAVSPSHDVGALIYSPNSIRTSWLTNSFIHLVEEDPSLTDMTALNRIFHLNDEEIATFPSWSAHWQSPEDVDAPTLRRITNEDIFGMPGIVDGSTVGIWLTGRDPRNNYGRVTLHEDFPGSFTDTSLLDFHMSGDALIGSIGGLEMPIHSLHIHSKNRRLFSDKWAIELSKFVKASSDKKRIGTHFSLYALSVHLRAMAGDIFQLANLRKLMNRLAPRFRNETSD